MTGAGSEPPRAGPGATEGGAEATGSPASLVAGPGPPAPRSSSRSALRVGGGILLSRITGFARDLVIAGFFGTGMAAGAYQAALKIPNVIRNLLGEGTLSAAFIPVYSAMLGREGPGGRREAGRLARSILGVLLVLSGLLAGLGVLLAPLITRLFVPGYAAEATALTTRLVRILFPMAGLMILAAWCLGVLNSHRRFFLPYAAPVVWNLAQIAGLFLGSAAGWEPLIHVLAWSTLAGALLQLAIQVPTARRLAGGLRPRLEMAWEPVRRVVRNSGPVIASQGIFQFSSFMDVLLGSLVSTAAVAGLGYGQRLAYLPLSLFGVSVATAELPEMSRRREAAALRRRLSAGFLRILYFVLPSAIAFLLVGDLMVEILFQRGAFDAYSTGLVSAILAAYALGLVASSATKLFAGGFHALQDTRTPMRFAAVAVATGVASGAALMWWLRARGYGDFAVLGIVLGGVAGAWLNLGLLWEGLGRRVGPIFGRAHLGRVLRLVAAAVLAAAAIHLSRGWLEPRLAAGLGGRIVLLTGTLAAGGVPYLAVAGGPAGGPAPREDTRT